MLTMREIAKKSGVSVATVSRYINNNGYVGEETKRKIQSIIDKYEFTPNLVAKSLSTQTSYTIAVISPDMMNPFFPELVSIIEKKSRKRGYSLTLIQQTNLSDDSFWLNFKNKYIDGFILITSDISMNNLEYLKSLKIPFVKIDRAVHSDENLSVSVDNFSGAKLAVNHLVEIGCKHIAHISGPKSIYTATERLMGYYEAIFENKLEPIILEGDFSHESGRDQTIKLLEQHPEVDGVFYANDLMAIGAVRAFKEKGYRLPEDIAIIGFDGIYLNEMIQPTISTIEQPIVEIGTIATQRLIDIIEEKESKHVAELSLDVKLIIRESTAGFQKK